MPERVQGRGESHPTEGTQGTDLGTLCGVHRLHYPEAGSTEGSSPVTHRERYSELYAADRQHWLVAAAWTHQDRLPRDRAQKTLRARDQ